MTSTEQKIVNALSWLFRHDPNIRDFPYCQSMKEMELKTGKKLSPIWIHMYTMPDTLKRCKVAIKLRLLMTTCPRQPDRRDVGRLAQGRALHAYPYDARRQETAQGSRRRSGSFCEF
jgi:hypothetical protein